MLKKIFIWWWILILLLINLPYLLSFYDNYTWKQFFEQKKYDLAKEKFSQANNIEWIYNIWNTLYKQGKCEDSIKTYLSILWTWKNDLNFKLNYNIANAYYRYGEKQTDVNLEKWYWLKAVDYYKKALKIKYDQQAKDNLEFILKKLKDLENQKNNKQKKQNQQWQKNKKQQSQKQNWQKKGNQNKQGQWKKKDSKNQDKQKNPSSKNWQNQWEKKKNQAQWWNWNKSKTQKKNWKQTAWARQNKPQTEEEKRQAQMMKALQEYQKNLKKQQKQNMWNYGKVYQIPRSNDPFDDPFFTWMPRENNIKDW